MYPKRANYVPRVFGKIYASVQVPQADGSVLSDVIDITAAENQPNLPTREEMTIEAQLASGVPLQQVPCGSLLNPTDPANIADSAEMLVTNLENSETHES